MSRDARLSKRDQRLVMGDAAAKLEADIQGLQDACATVEGVLSVSATTAVLSCRSCGRQWSACCFSKFISVLIAFDIASFAAGSAETR